MDKQKQATNISGGIFLIGLGVLGLTNWWWPGIMLVIGLSGGAELIFRGQTLKGLGTIAFFGAFPIIWELIQRTSLSWSIIGPFALIAIGVIVLVRSFYLKPDEDEYTD